MRWRWCAPVLLLAAAALAKDPQLPDSSNPSRGLDLSGKQVMLIYEADFFKPLNMVKEPALFEGEKRVKKPDGFEWVLEGWATAEAKHGKLKLSNEGGHLVFWNTREFPADLLIEFEFSPQDDRKGLAIVFFAAKGRDGGSIFDLNQPKRTGEFKRYHSGEIDCYHTSYWANNAKGEARGTAHIRKNHGFALVAMGRDYITGTGTGPHRVRILKIGPRIEIEVDGKLAIAWTDPDKPHGAGFIGLRQMSHTRAATYGNLKVYAVSARESGTRGHTRRWD
jgi:hypothetical protein